MKLEENLPIERANFIRWIIILFSTEKTKAKWRFINI